jgi:hypothetical protein
LRIAAVIRWMYCREGSKMGLTNFAAQTMVYLSRCRIAGYDRCNYARYCRAKARRMPYL